MYVCPACGYPDLPEPAWDEGDGSQEICPRCRLQFGYDDACGGDEARREAFHRQWGARFAPNGDQG